MNDDYISIHQLDLLPKRVEMALKTDATSKLQNVIQELAGKKADVVSVLVVGAGGSYSAAVFATHALEERLSYENFSFFAEAVTPQTALMKLDCKYDLVIGISYSGRSPDITAVANECSYRYIPFLLITGANPDSLKGMYDEEDCQAISYYNPEDDTYKEHGMISMASTLIPCMLFYDACECGDNTEPSHLERIEDAKERMESIKKAGTLSVLAYSLKAHPMIHLLYDYHHRPVMRDLESKLTESGIACVMLHEKKNFSHGRTSVLFRQDFGLIINLAVYGWAFGEDIEKNFLSLVNGDYSVDYANGYEKKLASFLKEVCKEKHSVYYEMRSVHGTDVSWNLDCMCQLPYWITYLGEALEVDVSKPVSSIPCMANDLYRYEGSF